MFYLYKEFDCTIIISQNIIQSASQRHFVLTGDSVKHINLNAAVTTSGLLNDSTRDEAGLALEPVRIHSRDYEHN